MSDLAKPRLVVINHSAQMSGAEIALLNTLRQIRSFRIDVILGEGGPLETELERIGAAVVIEPLPDSVRRFRRAGSTFRSMKAAAQASLDVATFCLRMRRAIPPDTSVVMTNSMKAHFYGVIAARSRGIPVACYIRDRLSRDTMNPIAANALRLILLTANEIIANSGNTADSIGSMVSRRFDRTIVPSPVVQRPYLPREWESKIIQNFALIGRISPWKGQDLAIRAFHQAFGSNGGSEQLQIVGGALFEESDYLEHLHDLVATLGLQDRVVFTGHVSDVYSILESVDCVLHSSLIPEPLGQVVIQGMANSLPVIASGEGGPAEIITDGVDGFLFEPRSVDSLARAMTTLQSAHGISALTRAANARSRDYGPDAIASKLENALNRTMLTKECSA